MAAGRPTKYSEDILKLTDQYITGCEDEEQTIVSGESEKFTSYKVRVKVKMPTIEGLSLYLNVHKDTIFEWDKQHKEFSDLLSVLRAKQCDRLINKGLSGDYNPFIAKLILSKHGYAEKQEIEHSTPEDQVFTIGGQTIKF